MYEATAEVYTNRMLLILFWHHWEHVNEWDIEVKFGIYHSFFMYNHNAFTFYLVEGLVYLPDSGNMNPCQ